MQTLRTALDGIGGNDEGPVVPDEVVVASFRGPTQAATQPTG